MSQRLMVRPTKFLHCTLLIGGLLFKPLKGGTSLACVSSVRTGFLTTVTLLCPMCCRAGHNILFQGHSKPPTCPSRGWDEAVMNKLLAVHIGCTWLPVFVSVVPEQNCLYLELLKAYVITLLSVIALTLPSLGPGRKWQLINSFYYSHLSPWGALHPNSAHKIKQNKTLHFSKKCVN